MGGPTWNFGGASLTLATVLGDMLQLFSAVDREHLYLAYCILTKCRPITSAITTFYFPAVTVHCTVVLTELARDESLDAFPPAAHSARDFVLRAIGPASICMTSHWAAAAHTAIRGRVRARGCQGGTAPPKFCPAPPVALPKFFRSLSESPTQTIDSSPCCKAGPSSGPPKWKCLAPPLVGTLHGHTRKNACYRNLKWTFEDFMPYYNENQGQRKRCKWHIAMPYCYATKTYSKTIR